MVMKKGTKRAGAGSARPKDLLKPFDFCCDINHQDPETRYDMRIPPFETSLTKIPLNKDGPDLKFRIQDIGKPAHPVMRSATHKVKSAANLGSCKRSRGPLRWYIEDEIALAQDIIAKEKEMEYKRARKAKLLQKRAKLKKAKARKNRASKAKDVDPEREGSEKDDEETK